MDDHKKRFDALLSAAIKNEKPTSGLVHLGTIDIGCPMIMPANVDVSSSTTTQAQIDAFIAAAARGEICGL